MVCANVFWQSLLAGVISANTLFREIEEFWIFKESCTAIPLTTGCIVCTCDTACTTCGIAKAEITTGTAIPICITRGTGNAFAFVWIQLWV